MPDRFDWFNEAVVGALAPMAITPEDRDSFHAEGAALALGVVQVARFSHSPLRSWRTPRLIRALDPEQYQLGLVTRGSMWLSQNGGEWGPSCGDLVLWDTSRPFEAGTGSDELLAESFILQIPKERMPLPSQQVDRLLARPIPGTVGIGAVLADFLVSLAGNGSDCVSEDLGALGGTAVELAATCLGRQLGSTREVSAELRAHTLLRRVDAFIEHHLADPELTPQVIAEHHHISLRHLYTLFENRQEGVAAAIRRRRLEHCRSDLASAGQQGETVSSIAVRWGFTSAAAFSRTFRAAYDTSPTEFRAHALKPSGRHESDSSTPQPAVLDAGGEQPGLEER